VAIGATRDIDGGGGGGAAAAAAAEDCPPPTGKSGMFSPTANTV